MTGRKGKREPTEDDALAWWWAVRETEPLKGRPRARKPQVEAKPERAAAAPSSTPKPRAALPRLASGLVPALAAGKGPGLDRRTMQRLARGLFSIEATLDLHGLSRNKAHEALLATVAAVQGPERRCILVVTGHGRRGAEGAGVLRELLPRWLNEPGLRARVLAFATAQPRHGGQGATYVLLRRKG
jgi:DNA-nicking Smr family endonuclease